MYPLPVRLYIHLLSRSGYRVHHLLSFDHPSPPFASPLLGLQALPETLERSVLVRDLSNRNSAPSVGHRPVSGIGASSMDRIQPLTKPDESKTSWPTLAVQSSQVLRGTVTRHVARFGAGMGYRVFGLRLRLSSLPALRHLFLRC